MELLDFRLRRDLVIQQVEQQLKMAPVPVEANIPDTRVETLLECVTVLVAHPTLF